MRIGDISKVVLGGAGLGMTYFFGKLLLLLFIVNSSGIKDYLIWFLLLCLLILGAGIFSIWIILEGFGIIKKKKVKKRRK